MSSFQKLRQLLQHPSQEHWKLLLNLLEEWESGEEKEVAYLYAEEHLGSWSDSLRVFRKVETKHPGWLLARRLELENENYPLRKIETLGDGSGAWHEELSHFSEISFVRGKYKKERLYSWLSSPMFPVLKVLELAHLYCGDELVEALQSIDGSRLERLDIQRNSFSSQAMRYFRECSFPTLEYLDLDESLHGSEAIIELSKCEFLKNLRVLGANNLGMEDKGLIAIADSPFFTNLEHFALESNSITSVGVEAFCNSPYLPPTTYLWLSHNDIGDSGFERLVKSTKMATLRVLLTSSCGLTNESIRALPGATFRSSLTRLGLGGNHQFDEDFLADFAGVPSFPKLRDLRIDHVHFSSASAETFFHSEFARSLQIFLVFYHRDGNQLCKILRGVKQELALKYIFFSYANISHRGLMHLKKTTCLPHLEMLILWGNKINDKTISQFDCKNFPKLNQLGLGNNEITPTVRKRLEKRKDIEFMFENRTMSFDFDD